MGLEAPERARILGHSVETNLKHYTFSRDKEFLYEVADIWDKYNENNGLCRGSTTCKTKKKHLKTAYFQVFQTKINNAEDGT